MTYNPNIIVNPFIRTRFTSRIVKSKGKLYTYFVFNNFNTENQTGLINSLFSIPNNLEYKLILQKQTLGQTLGHFASQIKSLVKKSSELETDVEDTALRYLQKFTNQVQDMFNPTRNEFLDLEQEDLIEKREKARQTKQAGLITSVLVRIELKSSKEINQISEIVELKALELGINLENQEYIQDQLHKAWTGQRDLPAHLKFNLEQEDLPSLNPMYYPTTIIDIMSLFLGYTLSNQPFFQIFNLRKQEANHILVVGTTASGKSAKVKDLIIQSLELGNRVIVIDPKGEYKPISKAKDGYEIDASQNKGINLFNLNQYNSLIDINTIFQTLFETLTGAELSNPQKATLNSILNKSKKSSDNFGTFLSLIKKSSLSDYADALENENIIKLLSSDTNGSLTEVNNKFIRFSFDNISGVELSLFVMIVARIINTLAFDTSTPTILVIDEAFKFLSSGANAKQIVQWFRILRSFNITIVCIDQDAREYGETANTLFSLCEHCLFFRHDPIPQFDIPSELYQRVKGLKAKDGEGHQFLYINKTDQKFVFLNSIIGDNNLKYVQPE